MSTTRAGDAARESAYLTIPQAAERLNVSQRFIERLTASGALPVHRFGRAVRIKRTTLDRLADDAAAQPLAPGSKGRRRG